MREFVLGVASFEMIMSEGELLSCEVINLVIKVILN